MRHEQESTATRVAVKSLGTQIRRNETAASTNTQNSCRPQVRRVSLLLLAGCRALVMGYNDVRVHRQSRLGGLRHVVAGDSELASAGHRNVAKAITRDVTARRRKGSSDSAVGDACLWAEAEAPHRRCLHLRS